MKISNVETFVYFAVWRNLIIVKVETDEGLVGVGEATLRNKELAVKEAIDKHIGPMLAGRSPFDIETVFNQFFTRDAWRNGVVFNSAISAIEMAMWDIIGKKLGVPVYNLLGGRFHQRIRLYCNGWFVNGTTDKEQYSTQALRALEDGFTSLKWDPLKCAPQDATDREKVKKAIECAETIRETVGEDVDLLIELHGNLDYDSALKIVRALEAVKPLFVEEPLHPDDKEGYRKLAVKSNIPIAAGERTFTRWGYKEIFEQGHLSIIQPDISHMGGIFETKKTAAMAEAYFLKVAPHNSNGPVATMANVMLDTTLPNFLIQEFFHENLMLSKQILKERFIIEDGCLVVGEQPGLGIIVDFDELAKGEYKSVYS